MVIRMKVHSVDTPLSHHLCNTLRVNWRPWSVTNFFIRLHFLTHLYRLLITLALSVVLFMFIYTLWDGKLTITKIYFPFNGLINFMSITSLGLFLVFSVLNWVSLFTTWYILLTSKLFNLSSSCRLLVGIFPIFLLCNIPYNPICPLCIRS